jgi:hypothetical protein
VESPRWRGRGKNSTAVSKFFFRRLAYHWWFRFSSRSNGFRPKAAHGFEAMPAIRGPETSLRRDHCDDRVEKTPGFVNDVGKLFVVSIGEIPLEGSGFDGIDWQDG